ncbi:MAG: hypothetical protein HYX68_18125 [Planctomycetes bacterium]|nr:hypothetical protein [Planctomycetota bacterium]
MGSDMVVALKEASANRTTLFGVNHYAVPGQRLAVQFVPGATHDAGDVTQTATGAVPQARQTFGVLGVRPVGTSGYLHGVNENRVALGVTRWQSRRASSPLALSGVDLARLGLERSRNAHHAVEVLTDLLEHFGENAEHGCNDHIFLIADATEAFALEASGRYWAMLECTSARAVTEAAMIRQDWRRLAHGLADFAIEKGWWQDDGNKLDFVRTLAERNPTTLCAQKRWGRITMALMQQQGAIDLEFLRRMLAEQDTQNATQFPEPGNTALACNFLVDLHAPELPTLAWLAFGSPRVAVHFPLSPAGSIPPDFSESRPSSSSLQDRVLELEPLAQGSDKDQKRLTAALERLQTKFDLDAEEFLARSRECHLHGRSQQINQLASEMMHHHVVLFDREYRSLLGITNRAAQVSALAEEELFFA